MNGGPVFLGTEDVLAIHRRVVVGFGGDPGLRDRGPLESAVAMPRAMFAGAYLHTDLPHMAAAYHYHLCANHPFVDGNKRTAFVAVELFLDLNGHELTADDAGCVVTMLQVAAGDLDEPAFAAWIRAHLAARTPPT